MIIDHGFEAAVGVGSFRSMQGRLQHHCTWPTFNHDDDDDGGDGDDDDDDAYGGDDDGDGHDDDGHDDGDGDDDDGGDGDDDGDEELYEWERGVVGVGGDESV